MPSSGKCRAEAGVNDNGVAKVRYYGFMQARLLKHKVRRAISIKVGHHSPRGWRDKTPVGAVGGSSRIAGYDSEVIRRARSQAAYIRSDVLRRNALVILGCGAGAIVSGSSIIEMNSGNRSVWIDNAIEHS